MKKQNHSSKPTLLLFGGFGWSASSPLAYTLQRNANYCHFGYTKIFRYLENHINPLKHEVLGLSNECKKIYNKVKYGTYENNGSHIGHKMNLTVDMNPIRDFPLEHFTSLITGEPTISKYIEFYTALYHHVSKKGYKAVADGFSLTLGEYRENKLNRGFMVEYFDEIKKHFNVKVLFIARDPIRRAWGEMLLRQYLIFIRPYQASYKEVFNGPARLWVRSCPLKYYKHTQNIFGPENVHMTTMEDLWEGDGTAKTKLSKFLDHPIDNLWRNLYSPDTGPYVKYHIDVPCQSPGQHLGELKPDLYYFLKQRYQYIYCDWQEEFNDLPLHWGKPLSYPSGKPL